MSAGWRLGVPDALYCRPLVHGLDRAGGFDLQPDVPAKLAVDFRERPELLRGAFLSPLDYARHGGNYRILPGMCVASSSPTGTVRLFVNADRKQISTVAVDVRVTTEIVLAKILLIEKFRNLPSAKDDLVVLPMAADPRAMLERADAALVVNLMPSSPPEGVFALDVVEEWNDMTGLPYVHGIWIVREEAFSDEELRILRSAAGRGIGAAQTNAGSLAPGRDFPEDFLRKYFSPFSYEMTETHEESLSELFRYAFYHGVLGDIPDLNFFSSDLSGDSVH